MKLKVTVSRTGRTWYGRPLYSAVFQDTTGKIGLHGYARRDAEILARMVSVLIGDRPIGVLANQLARELALREPRQGEAWVAYL